MGSASLLAAASIADGCVLINYDSQASTVADDGGIEPIDHDGGLDAQVAKEASIGPSKDGAPSDDGGTDAGSAEPDASSNDAEANDADTSDAQTSDAGSNDAQLGDAESGDASTDAMVCTPNECGGCGTLAKAVGSACGACGVGRYACDGTDAVVCANDGAPKSPGNPVLIDDLEDGDAKIISDYGLSGAWYMVNDGTGGTLNPPSGTTPVPANVGALGSARSMHFTASGFTRWGAGMAVSLSAYGCGYDSSKQTGIEFHIKGSGSVLVSVATKQTVPVANNGTCVGNCNDLFATTITVPTNWAQRKAVFANLKQAGWGTPAAFDPTQVLYVQFSALPNSSLDLYVDNLSFY